jgi:uncharacterized protein (TIGR04255 family)
MTYPHAPITEAVMEIRVRARDALDVDALRALSQASEEEFPHTNEQYSVETVIATGPPTVQTITPQKLGFQFRNAAGDKVIRVQTDAWSFSKLAPYQSWEAFRDQGRELWAKYRELMHPEQITRVAVRYVNRLDLPLPFDDFKQFLRTVPEISPDLPQGLSNFFLQAQIPQLDIEALLILNMMLVPPPNPTVSSVVLDLDLFRSTNLPHSEEAIWAYLEVLRVRKNVAFEACITDAMRKRFY